MLDSTGAYPRASVPQGTVKVQYLALNGTRRTTIGMLSTVCQVPGARGHADSECGRRASDKY